MAPLRVLAVAEKPSVAKELADILSNKSYRTNQGASRFNRLFEFTVPYGGGQCQMTMTSVIGHLMEHEFAEEVHRKWSRCDPVELFTAPIRAQVPEDKQDVKRNLEEAARGRQELHLWLDCDREGEAIGFEVIDVCLAANPRLKVHRARFSALIPRDIFYALAHLVPPDQRQADAVRARTELDLRLGAAFTRLQTLTLQNEFEGLDGIMSYGPCQFPTMWFVVQRAKRIEAFVQETFWQIELDHKKRAELSSEEEASAVFTWARRRLFDRQSALVLYELCVERRVAVVTSVNGHEKKRWRPTPLSTVELQKEASRRLRIPSDRAMEIAERLYQQGYLSYPRTETDKFKEGFDLAALVGAQAGNPQWGGFARALQAGGFEWPRDGGHDDQAHPPIHPVKAGDGLGGDEARLYEYVARRFLACCSRDALGHETTVKLDLAGEVFSASGLMILEYNYLEVYTYDKWTGRKIPAYYEGEQLEPTALHLREGRTSAPDPLTEPDLISLMDEQGIGTDATIAEHIKKILDRGYAQKCPRGHFFLPLPLARALLDGYVPLGFDLGVPSLRAEMERDMGAVVAGALSRQHAIDKTVRTMRPLYLKAAANLHHLRSAAAREFGRADASQWPVRPMDDGSSPLCGTCGGGMTLRARPAPNGGAELRVLHCAACRQHHSLPAAGGLSSHAHRCPLCGFQVLEVTNRDTGKTHTVCPSCFKKPPAQAGKAAGGEMRCFSCTANCVLAGGAVPVRPCPKCRRGEVLFSRRKDASAVLECNGAAGCLRLYLPGGTALTKHDAQPCGWCGQPLLSFSFARRGLPAHLFHQSYDACCFCCHRHLHEVLQLSNDSAEGTKNVDLLCAATTQGQHAGGGAAGGGGGGFGGGGGCGGGGGLRGGQGGRGGRGGEAGSSFSGTVPTVDLEDLETSAALAAFNGLRGVDTRRGGRGGGRGGAAAGRGGGGGGGGGGPPPASGDCFKCGQAGHWSRDCPNGGGKGGFNGGGGFGGEPYGGGRGGGLDGKAGAARGGQGGGASASHRGGGRGRGDAGAAGRGGKAGSGAGRGAGSSGSPGPTKRKCSVCNSEGHNKRNCPNK